jgi:iron complex transport system ATP-binding protein
MKQPALNSKALNSPMPDPAPPAGQPQGSKPQGKPSLTSAASASLPLACTGLDLARADRVLVRGLALQVRAGERWAVIGPNGAGKSSLLLALAGLLPLAAGSLQLGAAVPARADAAALSRLRAYLPDRWSDSFPVSAAELVQVARYALRNQESAAAAALRAAELLQGLDAGHLAARDVRTLSRGERQRVALAATLAQDTPLVFLDEPIAHQDPRHQVSVLEHLAARRELACVCVLHDLNAAARFATHALLLHGDGRWQAGAAHAVLESTRLTELFATPIREIGVDGHRAFVSVRGAWDQLGFLR